MEKVSDLLQELYIFYLVSEVRFRAYHNKSLPSSTLEFPQVKTAVSQEHRARLATTKEGATRGKQIPHGSSSAEANDGVIAERVGLADETDEEALLLLTSHFNDSQTTTPFTPSLLHLVFYPHLTFL